MEYLVCLVLVSTNLVLSNSANASMMAGTSIDANKVVSFLETKAAQGDATERDRLNLALAKVGRDVVGLHSFSGPAKWSDSCGNCGVDESKTLSAWDTNNLKNSISGAIESTVPWVEKKMGNLETFQKYREQVRDAFGANSYEWAWFIFETGKKDEAKKILKSTFETEYQRIMTMKQATTVFGKGPLTQAELVMKTLVPMSDAKEGSDREAKMKKMKIHVSNIPQMQILT